MKPTTPAADPTTPADVLDFWLGDGMALGWPTRDMNERWFRGGAALDQEIKERFGADVQLALNGGLREWETPLHSRLALIVLLDQFTRNVFRASAQAFGGDPRAQRLVLRTIESGEDQSLPWVGRVFLYMPLMHAEDAALQARCVACFAGLVEDAPDSLKAKFQGNLDFARQHQDIIASFGRFPYRNAALGRDSTPEEVRFLVEGPRFGQ